MRARRIVRRLALAALLAHAAAVAHGQALDAGAWSRAAGGDAKALFEVAEAYEQGLGAAQNFGWAAPLMKASAERGHAAAALRWAQYLVGGIGVAADPAEALFWLEVAARPGGPDNVAAAAELLKSAVSGQVPEARREDAVRRAAAFRPASGPVHLPDGVAPPPSGASRVAAAPGLAPEAIRAALPRLPCAWTQIQPRPDGTTEVLAFAPSGTALPALAPASARLFELQKVRLRTVEIDRGKCAALALLAEARIEDAADVAVTLRGPDGATTSEFRDGDPLAIDIVAGSGPNFLALDFLMADGTVLHMVPSRATSQLQLAAGQRLRLGEGAGQKWEMSAPFGNELLVAFLSDRPLYDGVRGTDDVERTQDYVNFLRARLLRAGERNRVRVVVRVVRTLPR